jgi:hypothetical protein
MGLGRKNARGEGKNIFYLCDFTLLRFLKQNYRTDPGIPAHDLVCRKVLKYIIPYYTAAWKSCERVNQPI